MEQLEPKKSLQQLTLLHRFLFDETMENPENLKIVLDIIFDDDIILKELPQTEKEIRRSELYRYAKVDVWAKDNEGTIYDTEVQGKNTCNLPKRTRYYQAMIDSKLLPPGEDDFNKLNRLFVIMIMPFDLFGYGLYRYTFVGQCLEVPDLKLDDGATRIFLNTHGTNDQDVSPELVQLLQYIEHTNDENLILEHDRLKQLRQNVKSVQENAEVGVKYMRLWEEFLQERRLGREEGLHEGRIAGEREGRIAGEREGKIAGEREGEQKAQAETVISFLEDLGKVSDTLREKITSEKDLAILKDWTKTAARAESIEAFEKEILS